MQRRTIHFSGRVQGVGFRYTARELAARHPVTGYVRNLPDGRVEMVAEGTSTEIDAFLDEISNQMKPCIMSIEQSTQSPSNEFKQFEIRR